MRYPISRIGNEEEIEVRGAHFPKIAEGGAASAFAIQAIQIKAGPAPT
jgi:hypothetical protein